MFADHPVRRSEERFDRRRDVGSVGSFPWIVFVMLFPVVWAADKMHWRGGRRFGFFATPGKEAVKNNNYYILKNNKINCRR